MIDLIANASGRSLLSDRPETTDSSNLHPSQVMLDRVNRTQRSAIDVEHSLIVFGGNRRCPTVESKRDLFNELNDLLEAELGYATFNARRTAARSADDTISRAQIEGVPYVLDSARPLTEYYNRAVIPPDFTTLADVVRQLPSSIQAVELLFPQQTEANFSCLSSAGFSPASSLCYLVANPNTKLSIEHKVVELRPDQREDFFDLLELSGASFSPEKRSDSGRFYCTEEFRCFVAYDTDDSPAGWATMYVDEGNAFLANAFTRPEYRGRGFHSALLSARLDLASTLHLTKAFTDVEPASQSHRNCLRSAFQLLSVNNIWKRTPKS